MTGPALFDNNVHADDVSAPFGAVRIDISPAGIKALAAKGKRHKERSNYAATARTHEAIAVILEKGLGLDDPALAIGLNNLAYLYSKQGLHSKAMPLYQRAIAIQEKTLEPNNLALAISLNNLADLYVRQGRYSQAISLYKRSLDIKEKMLTPSDPDLATGLQNLALAYSAQREYSRALPLYQRAIAIQEKTLGPQHPALAISLNNLGHLYGGQGRHKESLHSYKLALAIQERAFKPGHPDLALTLNNIAHMYSIQGQYERAFSLYERAISIQSKALGSQHPDLASSLTSLAKLLDAVGLYEQAALLNERALTIREKVLDKEHPDVGLSLNNLAGIYLEQGRYRQALPLLQRALVIREKTLGPNHLELTSSLNNLSAIYQNTGQLSQAVSLLQRSLAIQYRFLTRELPLLPVQQRSAQLAALGHSWLIPFSMARNNLAAVNLALSTRLNRHGLTAEIEHRQRSFQRLPTPAADLRDQLGLLTTAISSPIITGDQRIALFRQHAQIEEEFYRILPQLNLSGVSIEQVRTALPADGVLVELQRFEPFTFGARKQGVSRLRDPHYMALILRANGEITSVDVGSAAVIEQGIHRALAATEQGQTDAMDLWRAVSNQVLGPLMPYLRDSRQWFLSPDSELSRVPYAVLPLPGPDAKPLGTAVQLRLITTGRDLLRLKQPSPAAQAPLIVVNPSYDRPGRQKVSDSEISSSSIGQSRSAAQKSSHWKPLPATQLEGQRVARLLSGSLLTGHQATTKQLLDVQSPRILHVATHGFFLADSDFTPLGGTPPERAETSVIQAFTQEDPQLRSGLVLAGANQPEVEPNDDGYLTASEAVMLNLNGTELVVLSACSTGQGDIRTGEGVYGLQRALAVAGARSTLLSLWKVDDTATAAFMESFYSRLKAGASRSDALAATQDEFRNHSVPAWRHPYYWAAWQLVGDWRPIKGL